MSSSTTPPPGKREPSRAASTRVQPRPMPPRSAATDRSSPDHPHHPDHPGHPDHQLHLPAGAHVADRRGLTATGAVTIALLLGFVGAAIDVNTGSGLRTVFAICFIAGSALAALLVHQEDLKATVVMPPLTYCVLALIGAAIGHTQAAGSFAKRQGLELVSALILGAPVLYAATGLALLIALVRRRRRVRTAQQP